MERVRPYEASRAPSCSNVVINNDDIAKGECKRAYGLGSQCRPNECIFGSGKTPGGRDFGRGATWAGEGNEGVSLRATWERGGRILSQQGGFQVSGKGQIRGARGARGEGNNHVHNLSRS
jgi:hypothetical protein